jgi:hypothetical protein
MSAGRRIRRALGMQVWPARPLAWPFFFITLPSYFGLMMSVTTSRESLPAQALLYNVFMFIARPPVVWAIAALWLGMDSWLIYRVGHAWRSDGEPARPLKLFFLWQVTKIAFCLVYPALVYDYVRP